MLVTVRVLRPTRRYPHHRSSTGYSGLINAYFVVPLSAAATCLLASRSSVGLAKFSSIFSPPATFGAPAAGVRCATAIREAVRTLGLEIRVGLHAGEYKVSGAEVFGLAFHTGARVAAKARAGEVLVSSAVKDLMSQSAVAVH
jgi:hypothetical protein